MGIGWALLLCVTGVAAGEDELPTHLQDDVGPAPVSGVLTLRTGVWTSHALAFSAVRTDNTQAISGNQTLFSASAMAGVEISSHLLILASLEADFASKISADVVGVYLGWREHPKERYGKGVPDSVSVYAGGVAGKIKIHEADFGSFDRGYGFSGGLSLGWDLSSKMTLDVIGEYRYLKFNYQRDVISGDTTIGGSGAWAGAGLSFRF